jgi:hypothetical protein
LEIEREKSTHDTAGTHTRAVSDTDTIGEDVFDVIQVLLY